MPSIWHGADPGSFFDPGAAYEMGSVVKALQPLSITGVRIFGPAGSISRPGRKARVWDMSGTLLDTIDLPAVLPGGWSTYDLTAPIEMTAGQQLVISHDNSGDYGAVAGAFATTPYTSADSAMQFPSTGSNGRYALTAGDFPTVSFGNAFYGVDAIYVLPGTGTNTAPAVVSVTWQRAGNAVTLGITAADAESLAGASYAVVWGDGAATSGTNAAPTHIYAGPGSYAVAVRAIDADGAASELATLVVTVPTPVDTLVVFADARLAALEVLRANASAVAPGVTFGTRQPDVAGNGGPALPYVLVGHDAAYGTSRTGETAVVRLAVWARSESSALSIAQRARAVLLAYRGGIKARGFRPLTGPIPTTDPDSGTPLAYLTVAARLRPTIP